MSFRDQIKSDVSDVFLNLDEFASKHTLGNSRRGIAAYRCVIDRINHLDDGVSPLINHEGVFINALRIYVSEKDFYVPAQGEILSVDGSLHTVESVSVEDGMIVIVAQENSS